MRVLHIGKYYPPFYGGIESFMGDLILAQVRQGLDVSVLVHNHASVKGIVSEQIRIGDYSVDITRVPTYGRLLYAPVSPRFPFSLMDKIDSFKPDLLHLHLPNTSAFWALLITQARKIPWVIHWHSDVVSENNPALMLAYLCYRPLEKKLLAKSKAIIATSKPYLNSSIPIRDWMTKCHVIPLGLSPVDCTVSINSGQNNVLGLWGRAKLKILCLGRLSYYKGHDLLIEAMQQLDNTKLVIVGEGEKYKQLESQINSFSLKEKVCLLGSKPNSVVLQLISSCDCICLASTERTEAFGMVLLEAMAHGKAVVATDVPGSAMSWVVKDGVTGKLVKPGNKNELVAVFKLLANQTEQCTVMGREGKKRFNRKFHIKIVASQISSVYQQIIKGSANG